MLWVNDQFLRDHPALLGRSDLNVASILAITLGDPDPFGALEKLRWQRRRVGAVAGGGMFDLGDRVGVVWARLANADAWRNLWMILITHVSTAHD